MKLQTFLFLFLGVVIALVYVFRDETVLVEDDNSKVVDSLRLVIANDAIARQKLNDEIMVLNQNISDYESKLEKNQQQLNKLKKNYNEKIDSIRRMSHGDIEEYFAKRYQVK